MGLSPVEKRSLPDKVFDQLTSEIISGRYAPGAMIPSERELADILTVNRHVVREAIKRLQQIGLLSVTQGGRTTVLDFHRTAGLDMLAIVAGHAEANEPPVALLVAVLEMRAGIGTDVARLCAQRAGSHIRRGLLTIAEELRAAGEGPELLNLDQRFWQLTLDGAGNIAYQLAFNSLIRAVHSLHELSVSWLEQELKHGDYRRPIAAAIAAGDPDRAAAAARVALEVPELSGTLALHSRSPAG